MISIFYFAGERDPREIALALSQEAGARWAPGGELLAVGPAKEGGACREYRIVFQTHASRAVHALMHRPVDLLVIDNRRRPGDRSPRPTFSDTPAAGLLSQLLPRTAGSHASPIKKRHIIVLLDEGEDLLRDAFESGYLRVGGILSDPFARGGFLAAIDPYLTPAMGRKVALCLSGGGVEGLIYELGVLVALDRVMANRRVTDFDIFCGISAGAVISSFLVNGVSPADVARGFQGGGGPVGRMDKTTIFWPNFREVLPRLLRVAGDAIRSGRDVDVEGLLWSMIPSGAMNGERLKWYMERQLTRPGMTNNFNQVGKEVYIGVTDEDNSNHVVLGEPGLRDIPLSHAVGASCALVPFYHPQKLLGRYYIDGAFTRTTNVGLAARHGAGLIIIVNPWVPLVAAKPGTVYRYGGAFTTLQALKAIIATRFFQDFENADDLYPHSLVHLFAPEGEELRQMKGTLMRFFYRIRLIDIAYRMTIQKIRERYDVMERDFRRFGITLVDRDRLDDESIDTQFLDEEGGKLIDFTRLRASRAPRG